jgi:hypothetical protein
MEDGKKFDLPRNVGDLFGDVPFGELGGDLSAADSKVESKEAHEIPLDRCCLAAEPTLSLLYSELPPRRASEDILLKRCLRRLQCYSPVARSSRARKGEQHMLTSRVDFVNKLGMKCLQNRERFKSLFFLKKTLHLIDPDLMRGSMTEVSRAKSTTYSNLGCYYKINWEPIHCIKITEKVSRLGVLPS